MHEKFEELYNETATYIDDLAERLLALNGKPIGTMTESLKTASVKEAEGNESAEQMVQNIYDDFTVIAEELKSGMDLADEVGDETTGDIFACHSPEYRKT